MPALGPAARLASEYVAANAAMHMAEAGRAHDPHRCNAAHDSACAERATLAVGNGGSPQCAPTPARPCPLQPRSRPAGIIERSSSGSGGPHAAGSLAGAHRPACAGHSGDLAGADRGSPCFPQAGGITDTA